MKIGGKQLEKYNQPETLVMVSLYPKKGEIYSKGTSGVASYAKNVVRKMGRPVVVLADYDRAPRVYEEDGVLVVRCFKKGRVGMWMEILGQLKKWSRVKKLLIQYDFSMYGGMVVSGLMLGLVMGARALGFGVQVISHHVITDVRKLSGHVGLGKGWRDQVKAGIYNLMFNGFYWLLGKLSQKIIVLEETLKSRLAKVVGEKKVVAIPHVVDDELTKMSKREARKRLGLGQDEAVVMFFGFVNWFKGADVFVEAFGKTQKLLGRKARFVIAGGESPTLKGKGYYQRFFEGVEKGVKKSSGVEMTGYVPQDKIREYFAAADLVVFPYREFMCASGVLSLVFSYRKPFIVSSRLGRMFEADDFKEVLEKVGLSREDLEFELNRKEILAATRKVLKNGLKRKMRRMAEMMAQKRGVVENARLYERAVFESEWVDELNWRVYALQANK